MTSKNSLKYIKSTRDFLYNLGFKGDLKLGVYNLNSKKGYSLGGDDIGWAASIIKVPIMVSVLDQINQSKLSLEDKLKVNHDLALEEYDYVTSLPEGSELKIRDLIGYMISYSDNEATNILVDKVGIENVNKKIWDMGMKKTMLGHLLAPGVPRYSSKFNKDGSNITCPNDMVEIFKQIYNAKDKRLSNFEKAGSIYFLSNTSPSYLGLGFISSENIKSKVGVISDVDCGRDVHEVGIMNNELIEVNFKNIV